MEHHLLGPSSSELISNTAGTIIEAELEGIPQVNIGRLVKSIPLGAELDDRNINIHYIIAEQ